MFKKTIYSFLIIVLLSLLGVLGVFCYQKHFKHRFKNETIITQSVNAPFITLSQTLIDEYEALEYSFEKPFIKLNPYHNAPLSCLIMFETDEMMQAKLTIVGKDNAPDLTHTFQGYQKRHILPVLGLYPNYENHIVIELTDKSHQTISKTFLIKTDKIQKEALFVVKNKQQTDNYYYYLTDGVIVDEFQNIRFKLQTTDIVWLLDNLLVAENRQNGLTIYDVLGQKINQITYPKDFVSFSHAMALSPTGHYLIAGSFKNKQALIDNQKKQTQRDVIVELDKTTGALLNTYDLAQLLNPDRALVSSKENYGVNNWCHINGLDSLNDKIIASCKNAGIVEFSSKTGKLISYITPDRDVNKSGRLGQNGSLESYLYTPLNQSNERLDDEVKQGLKTDLTFSWPIKTHNVRYVNDELISLYDNAGRLYQKDVATKSTSSAVFYQLDRKNKTIKEALRVELGVFSEVGSSVNLKNKNLFVFSANVNDDAQSGIAYGVINRYDIESKQKQFEALIYKGGNTYYHRAVGSDDFMLYQEL